jgi:hypothetical protein
VIGFKKLHPSIRIERLACLLMSIPELCPPQFLNGGSSYSNKEIVALRVKVFLFFSSLKFYRQSEHDLVSVAVAISSSAEDITYISVCRSSNKIKLSYRDSLE